MAKNQKMDNPETQDRIKYKWQKKKINEMIPNDVLLYS